MLEIAAHCENIYEEKESPERRRQNQILSCFFPGFSGFLSLVLLSLIFSALSLIPSAVRAADSVKQAAGSPERSVFLQHIQQDLLGVGSQLQILFLGKLIRIDGASVFHDHLERFVRGNVRLDNFGRLGVGSGTCRPPCLGRLLEYTL